jgi:hypothetical protein
MKYMCNTYTAATKKAQKLSLKKFVSHPIWLLLLELT